MAIIRKTGFIGGKLTMDVTVICDVCSAKLTTPQERNNMGGIVCSPENIADFFDVNIENAENANLRLLLPDDINLCPTHLNMVLGILKKIKNSEVK